MNLRSSLSWSHILTDREPEASLLPFDRTKPNENPRIGFIVFSPSDLNFDTSSRTAADFALMLRRVALTTSTLRAGHALDDLTAAPGKHPRWESGGSKRTPGPHRHE